MEGASLLRSTGHVDTLHKVWAELETRSSVPARATPLSNGRPPRYSRSKAIGKSTRLDILAVLGNINWTWSVLVGRTWCYIGEQTPQIGCDGVEVQDSDHVEGLRVAP